MTEPIGTPVIERFRLQFLPIPAVIQAWDELSPWIKAVQTKTKARWRPEDVYAEVRENRAWLYLGMYDDVAKGVLVLTEQADEFSKQNSLVMWIAYSSDPVIVDLTLRAVDDMAVAGKFSRISLVSPRKGWMRRLRPHGYNVTGYIYEKQVK